MAAPSIWSLTLPLRRQWVCDVAKNEDTVITKPNKGNGVFILDRKLYNNAIQEIIPDTFRFEKLNEDPT